MAPTKSQSTLITSKGVTKSIVSLSRRAISSRTQQQKVLVDGSQNGLPVGKRKADVSPGRNEKGIKRSALGNVTNAVLNAFEDSKKLTRSKTDAKKTTTTTTTTLPSLPHSKTNENQEFTAPNAVPRAHKVATRASTRANESTKVSDAVAGLKKVNISAACIKGKKTKTETIVNNNNTKADSQSPSSGRDNDSNKIDAKANIRRLSNEFEALDNEESHYMSALEDLTTSSMRLSVGDLRRKSITSDEAIGSTETLSTIAEATDITGASTQFEATLKDEVSKATSWPLPVPDGVIDFDRENWDDPIQVSEYAMDIFEYLKKREETFKIDAYLGRQPHLTNWMRTLLVDWMVEVQETFELNHETLYLAVKIVDIYLSKVQIEKEKLQLIGAAALFMSCKYDERTPPLIEDFLYICDGAYKQNELVSMEMDAFRTIGYDLGIPLSYRFLRRYARCGMVTMPELTLARFILEFSLMSYDLITLSDSKIAAACLYMALRMNNKTGWNKTLEYFSGYKLSDFQSIIPLLNGPLHQKQRDANKTIRNKYTHKVFYEVSKVPLMTNEQLLESIESIETL
ncbi:G2/mitotic-specific cyclin-B3 [Contarinia nasturtii]|uniref:G2/mitotic-specific cyclin-B3 n=1 Tax=Contarinia nasturtii TaxID=265458 RepID=UPI0012D479D1|nr:G2/mitotic-specific cyclin-B3 [Contarinia nasturtii]XP_031638666.1 G2/mitotic-specific cyclin-B3 [Contarinia nasturtii]XP_031638667.1 G2/mitotic-specific cyclin-B3 [Contarinia nasturtii]